MTLSNLLKQLYQRNRLLTSVGWLHVFALAVTLALAIFDNRQVLGLNTWIKPAKFMFSIAIYLWTIAWISEYIRRPRWRIRVIGTIISIVMIVESACILLQAARGTPSHFNTTTDFDAAVFQTMGAMIGIDMLLGIIILLMFMKPAIKLEPTYLYGIRLGLLLFLVGGVIGMVMIVNNAHTFGAPDGGPGLPLLNWSTAAGDMRIPHGLALHSLQVMPIAGFLFGKFDWLDGALQRNTAFGAFAAIYCAAIYATYVQAISGQPLFM